MFQPRQHRVEDAGCGLLAFVVIDDTTLGPAAGGIRTQRYVDEEAALADAAALARAMTYKCALAGLPAGGGKAVVMQSDDMDRRHAFERLGEFVDRLEGRFLTAGDMGTSAADLAAVACRTRHVYTDEAGLAGAVGSGCVQAMRACMSLLEGVADLAGTRIAVQGCGTVGGAVARAARRSGAELVVADIDESVAGRLATEIGARVVSPGEIFSEHVDILAPCARGGVIDGQVAESLRVRAVCGAANNILADAHVERTLRDRGIVWVPDPLSSAGAVILGVGRRVIGLDDCNELIERVYDTTLDVIMRARIHDVPAGDVARGLAEERILAARDT